ncbi:TrkA-C domain-containing protein [Desulfomicrobium norvegicum]|uniref:TrkA-C domain-containing protein n=1 Tax=Desulfomicrobium norvegicum (strain DSM 1741 / NCIMB 8310) TaxID=52561 RepID=A0A8G2FG04_DESNO|nr:SLC13 family permease [Desulfomicrobium norvegicum]SFM18699.1 TrkA-C domain-containing protein [Desulfomicrobium norvegicum]
MTYDQALIMMIIAAAIGMFLWGRWRHDMVAMAALVLCVLSDLVEPQAAFAGFGHPAVVTVACVLVLSRGLQASGAVDVLTRTVLPSNTGPTLSIAALAALGAVLSGFMNNVGALALLMPVAIQVAGRLDLPPGKVLMPLAFGSILGGTTTLIGTPPNLIIAGFRADRPDMSAFKMFDFSMVGLPLTVAGVVFIALIGWRLVPARRQAGASGFETSAYITEVRVPEGSASEGKRFQEIKTVLQELDVQMLDLVRNDLHVRSPRPGKIVRAGDVLILEADVGALSEVLSRLDLKLEEDKQQGAAVQKDAGADEEELFDDSELKSPDASETPSLGLAGGSEDLAELAATEAEPEESGREESALMEMAVLPESRIVGSSASDLALRTRYGINLLAVARQGECTMARLRSLLIKPGDVLLMQGRLDSLNGFAGNSGCVPLAQRDLRIFDKRKALMATGIMVISVGLAAFGLLPAEVSFASGVLASMALRTLPMRSVYEAVDWPVVVLLGGLLPVAEAMRNTGAADLIARLLLENVAQGNPFVALAVVMLTTMILTDLMNNAATAAVMAPIGLGTAIQLGVNPDTFLMAVAIGASCAFLTPIGHQNNTLILGPGGFRFGDYWRMGLPMDVVVIALGLPLLVWFWPL